MAFEIEWMEPALDQLTEITNTIRLDNPAAAGPFSAQLLARVDGLGSSPRLGAVYRRRRGLEIRQISFGSYRIFYRLRPRLGRIEILNIWHGARQEPKL